MLWEIGGEAVIFEQRDIMKLKLFFYLITGFFSIEAMEEISEKDAIRQLAFRHSYDGILELKYSKDSKKNKQILEKEKNEEALKALMDAEDIDRPSKIGLTKDKPNKLGSHRRRNSEKIEKHDRDYPSCMSEKLPRKKPLFNESDEDKTRNVKRFIVRSPSSSSPDEKETEMSSFEQLPGLLGSSNSSDRLSDQSTMMHYCMEFIGKLPTDIDERSTQVPGESGRYYPISIVGGTLADVLNYRLLYKSVSENCHWDGKEKRYIIDASRFKELFEKIKSINEPKGISNFKAAILPEPFFGTIFGIENREESSAFIKDLRTMFEGMTVEENSSIKLNATSLKKYFQQPLKPESEVSSEQDEKSSETKEVQADSIHEVIEEVEPSKEVAPLQITLAEQNQWDNKSFFLGATLATTVIGAVKLYEKLR